MRLRVRTSWWSPRSRVRRGYVGVKCGTPSGITKRVELHQLVRRFGYWRAAAAELGCRIWCRICWTENLDMSCRGKREARRFACGGAWFGQGRTIMGRVELKVILDVKAALLAFCEL